MSSILLGVLSYNKTTNGADWPARVTRKEVTMKTVIVAATIISIAFASGLVIAASDRCVVEKSEGKTLVITCRKDTKGFKPGSEIKIKTSRKAALEGC